MWGISGMSMLDKELFDDLFGPTRPEAVPPVEHQPIGEQKKLLPIKKNDSFLSYRPEVLKQNLHVFLDKLQKSGATYSVNEDRRARISCEDFLLQEQLTIEMFNNPELEALLILKAAKNDRDLMDSIEERACIRCGEGFSDSLFRAVLCNITKTAETSRKEHSSTDWHKELEQLGIN